MFQWASRNYNYNTLGNACDPLGAPHYKHTKKNHRIRRAQAKGWTERSRFHSRQGMKFCFSIASTPALWPTQWLPEKLSLVVKWSVRSWSWPINSMQRRDYDCVEPHPHSQYIFNAWCLSTPMGRTSLDHLPFPSPEETWMYGKSSICV